jgi:hypothetical protein
MLVDDHSGQDPEPGGDLGHPVLGRRPRGAERDHVAGHRRRPGRRARHHRPRLEAIEDGVGQPRPADRGRQAELVAAGQEYPGGILDGHHRGLVVGLRPSHRMKRPDVLDAELTEHGPVPLAGFETER